MDWLNNSTWQPIALFAAAALIHASYQTGISVLTLLSNHSLGLGHSNNRVLTLGGSYILGIAATTLSLLLGILYVCTHYTGGYVTSWWIATACITGTTGTFALARYFDSGPGTVLRWMPRSLADYLQKRSKKTTQAVEAFALGMMTALAELPLTFAPLLITALLLATAQFGNNFYWAAAYTAIICLPLLVMLGLIGGGVKVSALQKWRETNKGFMQFVTGVGLVLLSVLLLTTYGAWRTT